MIKLFKLFLVVLNLPYLFIDLIMYASKKTNYITFSLRHSDLILESYDIILYIIFIWINLAYLRVPQETSLYINLGVIYLLGYLMHHPKKVKLCAITTLVKFAIFYLFYFRINP